MAEPGGSTPAGSTDAGPRGAVLDRRSPLPLWAQLLADLRQRLNSGEFDVAFPGELALVADYQVSRHTVRDALRRLRAEGLVVAERGRRPRLAPTPELTQPLGALYSLFALVEEAGLEQRSIVRRLDVRADGVAAARLGLEESTPLVHLERLRLAGGEPLAVDRAWLPAQLAAPILSADFIRTGLYDQLVARADLRVTGGSENLSAVVPTESERALLTIGPTTGAFAIDRLGTAGDRPVEWRQTLVRGDRFSVAAEFSDRAGYRLDVTGGAGTDRFRGSMTEVGT